ncbi:MAG: hypothetical protein Q7S04_00380 [Candidatus Moranbacteria bacterium]|nr:hypothetical protein [Candidatus Moranbacteria bacterium]
MKNAILETQIILYINPMPQQLDLNLETSPDPKEARRKLEAEYKTAVGVIPPFGLTDEALHTAIKKPDDEVTRLRLEELKEPNTNLPFQPKRR